MIKQITHISCRQTSKVIALLSSVISFLFYTLLVFWLFIAHPERFSQGNMLLPRLAITSLILPLFSGLLSYLFTLLVCFCYNQISRWVGGIEFTVAENKDS